MFISHPKREIEKARRQTREICCERISATAWSRDCFSFRNWVGFHCAHSVAGISLSTRSDGFRSSQIDKKHRMCKYTPGKEERGKNISPFKKGDKELMKKPRRVGFWSMCPVSNDRIAHFLSSFTRSIPGQDILTDFVHWFRFTAPFFSSRNEFVFSKARAESVANEQNKTNKV